MHRTHRYGIGLGVVALSVVASLLAAPELPQEVAVHWNAAGEADGFMPAWAAMAFLPAVAALLLGVLAVAPRFDPLRENIRQFQSTYDWLAVTVVGLLAYVHGVVLLVNTGYSFDIFQAFAPGIAALYLAVGFVLDRARQNWVVGIRTPWTLSDEQVWDETHERAGALFKGTGLVALGAVALPQYGIYFVVAPAVAVSLYATVYSYLAFRRRQPTA